MINLNVYVHVMPSSKFQNNGNAVKTNGQPSSAPCPFLVPEKLTELGLYTPEQFESMFREAAEGDAKTLALFLKKYRQMGVLDFKGKDKKQIFAILRSSFPSMKQYSYRNFIEYF